MTFDKALESHKQKMSEREIELLADKMFGNLDYEKNENEMIVSYTDKKVGRQYGISFDKVNKKYNSYFYVFDSGKSRSCCSYFGMSIDISMELHLAIHQKLKELGWI